MSNALKGRLSLLLLLLWPVLFPLPSNSSAGGQELSPPERQKVLERLQSLQKNVHSLTAAVRQEKQLAALKKKVTVEGTVALAKPNLLRWEIERPERSLTVIDGQRLTVYHPDSKEAQVYALADHVIARNTMGFFTAAFGGSLEDMEKKFNVAVFREEGGIVFSLKPRSGMARKYLSEVVIRYNEETGLPREFEMLTPKGDRTVTILSDIKTNPALGPDAFVFKLPRGAWVTNDFSMSGN